MTNTDNRLRRFVLFLLCAALAAHGYLVSRNWTAGFMPGHEFRQAHTAIIAEYIDKENNFTPLYTVPLYGKPWVCPMEFPLYEWSVVGLSRLTKWPHVVAARTVSLACFYAMLPAVYLLLGHLGLPRERRLLPLVLILCCPVYIFYSRSFLMEAMVLMFAVWFLLGFVRAMQRRQLRWALVCALGGAGAGLIKSTTFFVWLLPAALYGAWCLWRAIRTRDVRQVLGTLGWGLGSAAVPGATVYWWVTYSDAIKEVHPSAHIFASKALTAGNFGMYDLAARFSPGTWRTLLDRWGEAIAWPWVIMAALAAGLVISGAHRRLVAGAFILFLVAQSLFPFAYALQEYYFYACAVFLMVALGIGLNGLLDQRGPWVVRAALLCVLPVVLLANYDRTYRDLQLVPSPGGTGLTQAVRGVTPEQSVIIVVGDDWSPIIPYNSQRKALMVRNGLELDEAYLERAFNDLADEDVSALIMVRDQRGNTPLVRRIAARFNLDGRPTFSHPMADVYLSTTYRENALFLLNSGHAKVPAYADIEVKGQPSGPMLGTESVVIPPPLAATAFRMIKPAPHRYRFKYGYAAWNQGGDLVLDMHPDAELWMKAPAHAKQVVWEFGIFPTAFDDEGDKTNGVEFILMGENAAGERRQIFQRVLDPVNQPRDRGTQREVIPYSGAAEGESLVFITRPNGQEAFDWTYTRSIEVK